MKIEIIYTDDYALIVSDEKIKEKDWFFNGEHILQASRITDIIIDTEGQWSEIKTSKKIIAHRPLTDAPILEGVPLLPEFGKEDDVKRISLEMGKEFYIGGNYDFENGVRKGYNKAKETYKYTVDDMIACWKYASMDKHQIIGDQIGDHYLSFIQSLQQPKRPKSILLETVGDTETINRCKNFNVEIGCVASKCTCENLSISKTITNSQGQTELIGTYYYE
jgi:hypothetical protein